MTRIDKENLPQLRISAEKMEPKTLNVYSKYLKFDIIVPASHANSVLENVPIWYQTQDNKSKMINPDIDNKTNKNGDIIFSYFVSLFFIHFSVI